MRTSNDVLRSIMRYMAVVLRDDLPENDWEVRYWGTEGTVPLPDAPFARVAAITPQTTTGPGALNEVARTFAAHLYMRPQDDPEQAVMEAERIEEQMHIAFEIGFQYDDFIAMAPPGAVAVASVGGTFNPNGPVWYAFTCVGVRPTGYDAAVDPETLPSIASLGSFVVASGFQFTWTAVPGANAYRVYRSLDGVTFNLLAQVASPTYTDSGAQIPNPAKHPPASNEAYRTTKVQSSKKRIPLYDYAGIPLDGLGSISYERQPSDYLRVQTCTIDRGEDPEDDRYFRVIVQPRVTWRRIGRVPIDRGKIVQEVRLTETVA